MAITLSRRLCRAFVHSAGPKISFQSSIPFCSSIHQPESEFKTEHDPIQTPQSPNIYNRPLENGMDAGIYKAILVGQVGQKPHQKQLRSGKTVTMLSVGTGGIHNNRRPFDYEEPTEYGNRSVVQWHRVSIYLEGLGQVVMKNIVPGSILYLEGNLETKIFTDPTIGVVRRVREIAIRRNGRLVFLRNGSESKQGERQGEIKGVGYY